MSAIARNRMKNWEVIADNLSKAGWSYGYVSAVDSQGRPTRLRCPLKFVVDVRHISA